jgi:hypothetical protein
MAFFVKRKKAAPDPGPYRWLVLRPWSKSEAEAYSLYSPSVRGFHDLHEAEECARRATEDGGGSYSVYQRLYDIHATSDTKIVQ